MEATKKKPAKNKKNVQLKIKALEAKNTPRWMCGRLGVVADY